MSSVLGELVLGEGVFGSGESESSALVMGPVDAQAIDVDSIRVFWDYLSTEQTFVVEGSDDGLAFTELGTTTANHYEENGLSASQTRYYRVQIQGETEYSNIASARTVSAASVDYAKLFALMGQVIIVADKLVAPISEVNAAVSNLLGVFYTNSVVDRFSGLRDSLDAKEESITSVRESIAVWADTLLEDKYIVLDPLRLSSNTKQSDVLQAIIDDMIRGGESVNTYASAVTAVEAMDWNYSDGTILLDLVLDGCSEAGPDCPVFPAYAGVTSELCPTSGTFTVVCTRDSIDGALSGQESFTVKMGETGMRLDVSNEGIETEVSTVFANTLIDNGGMDDFTDDLPDGWEMISGVAGTNVFQETVDVYREGSALKLIGGDGVSDVYLFYPITQTLESYRRYLVTYRVKAVTVGASATLTVRVNSGADVFGEQELNNGALVACDEWTLKHFYFTMDDTQSETGRVTIMASDLPDMSGYVLIDDLTISPVQYVHGFSLAIVPGATPARKRDEWTFDVSNADGHTGLHSFLRKWFRVQLPSSGSPTIPDSVAEDIPN